MAVTLEELQIKFTAQMGGLQSDLNGVKKQLSGMTASINETSNAFAGMAKAAKLFIGTFVIRGLVKVGEASLSMANEAVESENLFSESMRGMSQSAREWSEELSGSLGLNAYALRKNVGTMNVMLRSMGLSEQKAYDMSTSLVQLSEDMASFYNLSSEDMFQKIQSGMTGMAMPLKQLGILIEDGTAKQYAAAAGISNTTGELTQQEKVLARYAALMGQTKSAQGDLARTINSPANQLRVLNAQLEQAKINLGRAFQPIQAAVMPILLNLAKAATIAAQAIAYLMGGLGGMTGVNVAANLVAGKGVKITDKLTDSLQDTAKAYKKAGGAARQAGKDASVGLKGFDEINKVTEDLANGGGGGGKIDEIELPDTGPMGDFADTLETVSKKVRDLADKIKASMNLITPALAGLGAGFIAFKLTGNPAIASVVGAITAGITALVRAVNQARQARLDKAFGDIEISLEEAATIVDGMATSKTAKMLQGIQVLKDKTDSAMQAYAQRATYTKKVLAILSLLPMTTGADQFFAEVEALRLSIEGSNEVVRANVTAYLDALYEDGKLNYMDFLARKKDLDDRLQVMAKKAIALEAELKSLVNAALEDGVVDETEKETIRSTLETGSQGIVDGWEALRASLIAKINADLKAGRIPPGVAKTEIEKVNTNLNEEIAKHKLSLEAITANIDIMLLPMTTGEEQFYEELEKLREEVLASEASVHKDFEAYLDMLYKEGKLNPGEYVRLKNDLEARFQKIVDSTSKMEADLKAVVNAAMEDGVVDDSEKETIRETLQTGSQKVVNEWEAVRAAMIARINADLKAGRIPPGVAKTEIEKVNANIDAEIAKHKLSLEAITANIDKYNWTAASLTETQRKELVAAVQAEVTASEELLDAVGAQIVANATLLAGQVTGGESLVNAVSGIYDQARERATTAASELKTLLESGVTVGGPEFLAKVQEARKKYTDAVEYITNGITDEGAFRKSASALSDLSATSVDNFIKAFQDRMKTGKANLQAAYDEVSNFVWSFPEEAEKQFAEAGMTVEEGLAMAKAALEAGLSELASGTVMDMAKAVLPSLSSALSSGEFNLSDIMGYVDQVEKILSEIDYSSLDTDAKQAVAQMIRAFNDPEVLKLTGGVNLLAQSIGDTLGDLGETVQAEASAIFTDFTNTSTKTIEMSDQAITAAMLSLGDNAMYSLDKALQDNAITPELYNQVILAASAGTLEQLKTKLSTGGDAAGAAFVQSLLDQKDPAKQAMEDVAEAAAKGGSGSNDDFKTAGDNAAGGFVGAIESQVSAASAAARRLARAASVTLRDTLHINSPSRVTEDFGEMFTLGFVNKIKAGIPDVRAAASRLSTTAIDSMGDLSMSPMLNNQIEVDNGVAGAVSEGIRQGIAQVMDRLNINLNVDGEQFGKVSLRTINDAQRAAGRVLLEM